MIKPACFLHLSPFLVSLALALPAQAAPTYCNDAPGLSQVRKDRQGWLAKLKRREYGELDAFFNSLQREYEAGKKSDTQVATWFGIFDDASAELTTLLEAWVKQHPRSYAARRALAGHLYHVAWAGRGYNWADDPTPEKKESTRQLLDRMTTVLNQAEALTAKPTPSYPYRIQAGRVLAGAQAAREAYLRAEKLDPLNAESKAAYIVTVSPKWRGQRQQMDEVMANAAAWPEDLTRYVGYEMFTTIAEAYELAARNEEAIRMYESAATNCTAFEAPLVALVRLNKKVNNPAGVRAATARHEKLRKELGR